VTWLDDLTLETVIVHIDDGPSLKGLKQAVYDDGLLIKDAITLEGATAKLDGCCSSRANAWCCSSSSWRLMATLQTTDGRLLRRRDPRAQTSRPAGSSPRTSRRCGDGERAEDTDGDGHLVSYEAIYRSQPVVAGVVDKLSRRIATLPFDGYRKATASSREIVTGDSLDSLIRKPLPRWSTRPSPRPHRAVAIDPRQRARRETPRPGPRGAADHAVAAGLVASQRVRATGGRIEWWSTTQFDGVERFLAART
jgi:hypothetical protein